MRNNTANARIKMMNLDNETVINVATLLQEPVGAQRHLRIHLDTFSLDDDLQANDIVGNVTLIRLANEILAQIKISGTVELACVRCLREYDQSFTARFSVEYRPTVDIRTGVGLTTTDDDDEHFAIDDLHQLDIREPLRQEILVALPMRAVCGDSCPGPDIPLDTKEEFDERFASLSTLLEELPDQEFVRAN